MKIFRYFYYWCVDYLYIVLQQVRGLRRADAEKYATGEKDPVLIIPGVFEQWPIMSFLIQSVHAQGYPVYVIEGLGHNRGEVPLAAERAMQEIVRRGLRRVTILAHSKGGLIGKYAMAYCDPEQSIERMVAISAPFSGSVYAAYLPFRSTAIFSPTDTTLVRLSGEVGINTRIVSIYGEFDPHIPGGSSLEGAENIKVPVVGHFRIVSDPGVGRIVVESLNRHTGRRSIN